MKNAIIALCILWFLTACENKKTSSSQVTGTASATKELSGDTILTSLNGIDSAMAAQMIADFKSRRGRDKKPKTKSIWFSKDMIHRMVVMLHNEIEAQKAQFHGRTDTTDGIRIYYASDPRTSGTSLVTSVILVSTKDAGPCSGEEFCASGKKHADYYRHSSNEELFRLASINGLPCNGGKNCSGALLYKSTLSDDDDPGCTLEPHYITKKVAKKMVNDFKDHSVNTESVWFDLSLFEAVDNMGRYSGIRIYFGTKPTRDRKGVYRDAFVITTTLPDENNGSQTDYFDCKTSNLYQQLYEKKHVGKVEPAQDKGELCPDNCNTITTSAH